MKKTFLIIAVAISTFALTFTPSQAQEEKAQGRQKVSIEVIVGEKLPTPKEHELMKFEEKFHPKILQAMNNIEDAIRELEAAKIDFGGHKEEALKSLHTSLKSLRKALYYRLIEDTK